MLRKCALASEDPPQPLVNVDPERDQDRDVDVGEVDPAGTRDAVGDVRVHLARLEAELPGEGGREGAAIGPGVETGKAAEVAGGRPVMMTLTFGRRTVNPCG